MTSAILQRGGDEGIFSSWLLRVWLITFVPFAYDFLASTTSLSHSLELSYNRACLGIAMLPMLSVSARVFVRLGTRLERRLGSPTAGLLLAVVGIVISLGLIGVFLSKALEPGTIFHPERKCTVDDGLDDATRAIWKWKFVVAANAGSFLLALGGGKR